MDPKGKGAMVVGGASGMARSTAEMLRDRGASIAILDLPDSTGGEAAAALDGTFHPVDVTDDDAVEQAITHAVDALGGLHIAVNTAGGGIAKRTIGKDGPHPLGEFRRVVELNLVAAFNLNRLQAWHMSRNEPEDGERGVIIDTASIAAFEGQIGQVAYTAAKAGIATAGRGCTQTATPAASSSAVEDALADGGVARTRAISAAAAMVDRPVPHRAGAHNESPASGHSLHNADYQTLGPEEEAALS